MSLVDVGASEDRTIVHPRDWVQSPSPYSYALRTGDTVFLSGLVSRNGRDNAVVTGSVGQQTRVILDNAGELLHAAGLSHANIVQINDYKMNFVPEGQMLIMGSFDQPGVIGKIGTLMSENGINIGSWQTGRSGPGGHTLTVLTLDEVLPDAIMSQLTALDFIRHAHQVKIS